MKRSLILLIILFFCTVMPQCTSQNEMKYTEGKIVIYQVLPRLFGNSTTTNIPWGTIEENGLGKFSDFTPKALSSIRELGVTHIWYTGVPHHCIINDYTEYGIANDDPDVVKGRAGSPYAVKDYYNVNPDLADNPSKRLEEFEALIKRTHHAGLKVIIDIVPNHVARNYHSITNPEGVVDFGANDDKSVEYDKNNNFYYIPGQVFEVPDFEDGFRPLNGEAHPLSDGKFDEYPAKWTGNGSRNAKPNIHDWYETVKINFGIRPDGQKDFAELADAYALKSCREHLDFWKTQDIPDSWIKFEQIAQYWLDKGVDGFRYDMAQMVPVEFWSYLNSSIKVRKPDAILVSEIYVPEIYRDYIQLGKMDYLYDKVDLYDTLKSIIQGHGSTDYLPGIMNRYSDIEHHLLHFLENHDEHRIAAPEFAGDPFKALPAMVVSATISSAPTMIYFGQELGEKGEGDAGYGKTGRTTIFDYWGVPGMQKWGNSGKFDGAGLNEAEVKLRTYYKTLLTFTSENSILLNGAYREIHTYNREKSKDYSNQLFSFVRWQGEERILIVTNFSSLPVEFSIQLPLDLCQELNLKFGKYTMKDALESGKLFTLQVTNDGAHSLLFLSPLESLILEF